MSKEMLLGGTNTSYTGYIYVRYIIHGIQNTKYMDDKRQYMISAESGLKRNP